MSVQRAWLELVAALVMFVLAGVLAALASQAVPGTLRMPAAVVVQGLVLLAAVRLLLAWDGTGWRDLGLEPLRRRDWGRGLLALAACLGVNMLFVNALYRIAPDTVESHAETLGTIAQYLGGELTIAGLVPVLAFVGIYEEIFARGLLLSRCRVLWNRFWFPVLVSSLLFGLGHLYQGWVGVTQTTLIGIVLAVATLRWGTLWPAIIAHALLDIVSVALIHSLAD